MTEARLPFRAGRLAAIAAAVVVVILAPSLLGGYWLKVWISALIYAIAAAGVALLYARLGMVSLAQVALMGVGGWVCLRTWHATGWPFEACMAAAALATAAAGMLVGLPALRLRGLYLALVTMMAAGGLAIVAGALHFPNGGPGLSGYGFGTVLMARPVLGRSDAALLRYVAAVLALCLALVALHERGAPGRAWSLIRRGEAVAMSAGVDVGLHKLWAFGLAGLLAGVAGSLLAALLGTLDPRSFPASESILLLAITVVGGAFSPLGVLISGVLYRVVPAVLDSAGIDGNLAYVLFGAALLHALASAPMGAAGQLQALAARWQARRGGQGPAA
jgi:branched-chain amino acid transport system permease protein